MEWGIHIETHATDSTSTAWLLGTTRGQLKDAVDRVSALTGGGNAIDEHQVLTRRVAALAASVEAASALCAYSEDSLAAGTFLAEVASDLRRFIDESLGIDLPHGDEHTTTLRRLLDEGRYRAIGRAVLETGGENDGHIVAVDGSAEDCEDLRASTRRFARTVVAPEAEAIHRDDLLVPEHLIEQMAELGYFGMSVPEEYGGVGMNNLMMVVATEELSVASLPAAGSLITRPEILAKALLKGGSEAQKQKWLPRVATGQIMVAVSVTEPDTGSDVANLSCRAVPGTFGDRQGYRITGAKAWCTFAGRAEILSLLARTDADGGQGHKGLSLFIVEKERFDGHDFEFEQPEGGRMTGRADATIGYRGMHSFTLQLEDYFVSAENLVGEEEGIGRGFYLQMESFTVGRLQTGGRAVGLAQACLETAIAYSRTRPQFGQPISAFQNTEYELGAMAVRIEASRQLTHAAARAMDEGSEHAGLLASMAKLFASRTAVTVSQRAQLLHGGWGYAEEYPISRYVCDALVLPIFEGVEPILEMKVIGRTLLRQASQ